MLDGSSPHAWGTLIVDEQEGNDERFIPTCVGNSSDSGVGFPSTTVHPHMRGELVRAVAVPSTATGSSPHAWGTLRNRCL